MQKSVKQVTEMRKAQRAIQLDPVLSPDEKRKQIDDIQQGINDLAAGVWQLRPGGPISPEGASKLLGANKNSQAAILRREGLPEASSLVDGMPSLPTAAMSSAFKELGE